MQNDRMIDTFIKLVKVDSESKNEGKIHELLTGEFKRLGLEVYEDNTMEQTGLGANNLYGRLIGTLPGPAIFFACHSDTVTPGVGINPQIKDGNIYSDGTTILGADDKAGIAAILELAERLIESGEPHRTLEFIISPGEEIGLVGASAIDDTWMQAPYGFALDCDGPVGSIIVASPSLYSMEFIVKGKAAHAGLEPENGVSAIEIAAKAIAGMKLGRIDADTTANVGVINGGTATNIVTPEVKVVAEARSISHEACEEQVQHMIDKFESAAAQAGGSVHCEKDLKCKGFRIEEDSLTVKMASNAIKRAGRTPKTAASGGGSDANTFNARGRETVNLAIGYEKVHTLEEYIPIIEMEKALEMIYYLATDTF